MTAVRRALAHLRGRSLRARMVLVHAVTLAAVCAAMALATVLVQRYYLPYPRHRGRGGAGLGLAIAAAITQAHGGRVGAESAPGGTEFTVTLPLPTAPPSSH